MDKEKLLALKPEDISRFLTTEEVIHMAKVFSAFWAYDYEAAAQGKVGLHAILKSKLHSNGFFYSKPLLAPDYIRLIFSNQIAMRLREVGASRPDYVIGVPKGATKLGEDIAKILGTKNAVMRKVDDRIMLETYIAPGESVLLVEDFCTRGTGFIEAVGEVKEKQPEAKILPFNPIILNRGGLRYITVETEEFAVLPVVDCKQDDWEKSLCPLCNELGSEPIKPKETDENWQRLITSQL